MTCYDGTTLLTIDNIAERWGVSIAEASLIIYTLPTLFPEHRLADGSLLWAWPVIETVELAFPELRTGKGLEIAGKLQALENAFAALDEDASESVFKLVYDRAEKARQAA